MLILKKIAALNLVAVGISERAELTLKYAQPKDFLIVTHGCRDRQKNEITLIAE